MLLRSRSLNKPPCRRFRRPGNRQSRSSSRLGRQVLLSSDFYTVYQSLGRPEGVDNLWCWAHIRRYFIRAGDAHPELAAWPTGRVERIAALYTAHTLAIAQFCAALNTIDADATPNPAIPTCCTRPARRSSPPWTGNGTGWRDTASSPTFPWTIMPMPRLC